MKGHKRDSCQLERWATPLASRSKRREVIVTVSGPLHRIGCWGIVVRDCNVGVQVKFTS